VEGDLSDEDIAFGWAGEDRLIWEGYLDTSSILEDKSITKKDMVIRLDIYVGERDLFGIGFSDNVIFRQQHYMRALLEKPFSLYSYPDERFAAPEFRNSSRDKMREVAGGWEFDVKGNGFEATFRIEIDNVPRQGRPAPFG
jgi:hypothetical protein